MKTKINYSKLNWNSVNNSVGVWDFVSKFESSFVMNNVRNNVNEPVRDSISYFVRYCILNSVKNYEFKH